MFVELRVVFTDFKTEGWFQLVLGKRKRRFVQSVATVLLLTGCGPNASETVVVETSPQEASQEEGRMTPTSVDQVELDRLRALGYVDVAHVPPELVGKLGVQFRDEERMEPGLTFFTSALGCVAMLINAAGEVQHEWRTSPCVKWGNSVLLPNGDIITIHWNPTAEDDAGQIQAARELIRMTWDGEILWRQRMPVHHDLDVLPDGRLATLIYQDRVLPRFHKEVPVRDHLLLLADADGREQERASITDMLAASSPSFVFQSVAPRERAGLTEVDLVHSNSVEWMRSTKLAERDPLYALTNVLVCLRHQDVVAIFDWKAKRLVWSFGRGVLSGPHDASLLENGNILIFDNGLARKWSRVVEIDPRSEEIVWHYQAPEREEFFSATRGAAQRLSGGNTLITESTKGRIFEVTSAGEIVWEFRNPNLSEQGKPLVVVRARRVNAIGDGPIHFDRSD